MNTKSNSEEVRQKVRAGYGEIAKGGSSCCGPTTCGCGSEDQASKLVSTIGYSAEELANLPEGANLGLSCGNPNALASLQPGEVVLDLGAGAGFDVFIAGRKVGQTGRALGVDMTPEMLAKARRNMTPYRERSGLENVEFRLGEIEHLPVADSSVDVVISNCVINLSPEKPQVWREIARVLKPGGRVAVSDLALLKPLPPAITEMIEALVGCIAGAVLVSETERMAKEAGLVDIELNPKPGYIDGMADWQDPLYKKILAHLPPGAKPSDYITSLEIKARRAESASASRPGGSLYTPAVAELIAIGAAIASNCEACLKYHYQQAQKLGVSKADMASAVSMAAQVKDSPHQAILRLANRLTEANLQAEDGAKDCCCGAAERSNPEQKSSCCGK